MNVEAVVVAIVLVALVDLPVDAVLEQAVRLIVPQAILDPIDVTLPCIISISRRRNAESSSVCR
jgi:hypothetical protein